MSLALGLPHRQTAAFPKQRHSPSASALPSLLPLPGRVAKKPGWFLGLFPLTLSSHLLPLVLEARGSLPVSAKYKWSLSLWSLDEGHRLFLLSVLSLRSFPRLVPSHSFLFFEHF